MAVTKYTKVVATDFADGKINFSTLKARIEVDATIAPRVVDHFDTYVDGTEKCDIWMDAALDAGQQSALAAVCLAHHGGSGVLRAAVHRRTTLSTNQKYVTKEEWFSDSALTLLAKQITYTYDGVKCISYVEKLYFTDGVEASSITYQCFSDSTAGTETVKRVG